MTETDNVATYARIRPYNPAINEDKNLTARAADGNKILNMHKDNEDTYGFTRVYDMTDNTMDLFNTGMKPLLDYKILQGINAIFIVYGQSGSGKSFTLIGEKGHLGVLPLSLQYLLAQDVVEKIEISVIEAYGIKATKIGFYDLVVQLKSKEQNPKKYDAYTSKDNSRVNSGNAQRLVITNDNCLQIITELQEVSHMAPTLKNPHSSRGHTVYFACVKMTGLEDVFFIAVDLAGSEGQTALGTQNEFVNGLKLAMSKGKLKLNKKQMKGFEQMYKTRSLEAGCINNGLTQLQSIFGELIKRKISKAQGLGLRKILSSFINLNTAYAILFTLSASANNNKVTRATLNFAKQTQLVKVDTVKAKAKIDKDAIIKELNELIEQLKFELGDKADKIKDMEKNIEDLKTQVAAGGSGDKADAMPKQAPKQSKKISFAPKIESKVSYADSDSDTDDGKDEDDLLLMSISDRVTSIQKQMDEAKVEESKWTVGHHHQKTTMVLTGLDGLDLDDLGYEESDGVNMNEAEMKATFDEFDTDHGGTIDANELKNALAKMGQVKTTSEIQDIIAEVDTTGSGEISFEEFKVMVGQTWFVDAYEHRLVAGITRMMTTMNIFGNDDDDDDDNEEDNKEELKQESNVDNTSELIEEINEQSQKIQDLDIRLVESIDKNEEYEKEIQQLKKRLEEFTKKTNQLTKDVDRLKEDNDILMKTGGSGYVMLESMDSQREIIHIQVGQCGNNIGKEFWKTMGKEHKLDGGGKFFGRPEQKDAELRLAKIGVYYQEASFLRFAPRACLIDLEPSVTDIIKSSELGQLFKPDNIIAGVSGTGNNWAKGHYTEGAELIDDIIDIIRKETEGCNCPQGFQVTQSIGGGTGSGLGTLILLKLRDHYPDRIIASFCVFPSPKVSDVVVEPYNATLSINQLLENSDETFVIDNQALISISHKVLKQKDPKYSDLNWVISMVMSGITSSLRFSGKLNGDLRKMGVNLVPFPRLHFFLMAHAPLFAPDEGEKINLTVQEITEQMWSNRNFLSKIKSQDGKYLTASCGYRGAIATQEVDDEIAKIQQRMNDDFVTWIPNNIKTSIIVVPPVDTPISGTFVANTTAIKGVFQRISVQFQKLYRRKAFLHWYKGEGMDEMEFQESDSNVRDLITEYQDKQDVVVNNDDSDDDSDDDENDDAEEEEEEEDDF